MTDVFISYKRRLRPKVEEIAAALQALGLTVWYDAALEPGSSFSAEISEEVRGAGCVLVCWSNDAFPRGGDRNGWVLGEATIGHSRGRLVPVLLERADLDPPWNTIHTESLIGWSPDRDDHPGWRNVLAAMGRHIGRPDLAGEAAAAPAATGPRMPSLSMVAVTGLAAAAATAIGAALFAGLDPTLRSGYFSIVPAIAIYALPLAVLFHRAGVLSLGRAALLVLAFVVAFGLGVMLGIAAISPFSANPANYDLAEVTLCAIAGFTGGAVSLAAFPLLGLAPRSRATAVRIGVAGIALGALAALIAVMPFFNLTTGNSAVLWLGAIWQLAYAPLLVFVLRRPR